MLVIEDDGSSAGLWVNGVRATEPAFLHDGDHIRLGRVELELVGRSEMTASDATIVRPPKTGPLAPRERPPAPREPDPTPVEPVVSLTAPQPATEPAPEPELVPSAALAAARSVQREPVAPSSGARLDIGSQQAGAIHNVGRDSYQESGNRYYVERMEILAPMRKRARRVMRTGFFVFLLGLALGIAGAAVWDEGVLHCVNTQFASGSSCVHPAGFAMAGLGAVLILSGLITMIVSLFMKREVRRQEARL